MLHHLYLAWMLGGGCLTVAGDRITAAALAQEMPEFRAIPPETILGYSPVPGVRRVLRANELNSFLEKHGQAARLSEQICVEREARLLDRSVLLSAMRAALGMPEANIELVEYSQFPAPPGELVFDRKDLLEPSTPHAPSRWRGFVRYDGNRRFSVWATVRVTALCRRVVAVTPLRPGEPIQADQVREESYEGFPTSKEANWGAAQVAGRISVPPLGAGSVVTPEILAIPPVISKGDPVTAEYRAGTVFLSVPVVAERSGRIGEVIPVRNPSSKKTFTARVSGAGVVVVDGKERSALSRGAARTQP